MKLPACANTKQFSHSGNYLNLTYFIWLSHPSLPVARLPADEPALASIMTCDYAKDLYASELDENIGAIEVVLLKKNKKYRLNLARRIKREIMAEPTPLYQRLRHWRSTEPADYKITPLRSITNYEPMPAISLIK